MTEKLLNVDVKPQYTQTNKPRALVNFAVIAQLICAFVFAYAKIGLHRDAAHFHHMFVILINILYTCKESQFVTIAFGSFYGISLHLGLKRKQRKQAKYTKIKLELFQR